MRPSAVLSSGSLIGARVLVVRPEQQIASLCDAIVSAGGTPLPLPLQGIEPIPATPQLLALFDRYRRADRWLFTSANAVEAAVSLCPPPWPALAAVGDATAAALRNATGAVSVLTPEAEFSAAGLLALPEFESVSGRRFLVVTGASARVDIAAALRARGAEADTAMVYRRRKLEVSPQRIATQLDQADLAVITSGEALEQLVASTPAASRPRLAGLRLVVASARMVKMAEELGFLTVPLVPESIAVSAFIAVLAAGWSQRMPS